MNKMYILSEGFYDRAEKHVGLFSSFEKFEITCTR